MIKSEKIDLVSAALVKAQSAMGTAKKDSNNPFFKSKYADLNAIREAIMPALFENGLSIIQPMLVQDGKNYIETVIVHTSGQYLGGLTEVVHTKKDNAQDFGAGTTYARRFGLQSLLCVGAEDDDGNTVTGKAAPVAAKATPAQSEAKPAESKPAATGASKFKPKGAAEKPAVPDQTSSEDNGGWN